MKIVLAPNAFKDSLTPDQAARAMAKGVRSVLADVETVEVPVADGGDGLIAVMEKALGGERITKTVTGPRFAPVAADYLFIAKGSTAIVEMARSSGLALLKPEERDARETTTLGTGELALDALSRGAKHLIIGIGGSATNDGGIGFAAALGAKFLDANGKELKPIGANLANIARIDISGCAKRFDNVTVEAVCDVNNPLCGPKGAAAVFGPQKGLTPEGVAELDAGLANLADRVQRDLGKDIRDMPGAGAAGGLGGGLVAFVGAVLRPGVEVVLDMVELDQALAGADLVFTAEGGLDHQTAHGKAPAGVAMRAKKHGVPCLAIAGAVIGDIANLHQIGLDAAFSLCSGPMPLEKAMREAEPLLANATAQAFRAFLAGKRKG